MCRTRFVQAPGSVHVPECSFLGQESQASRPVIESLMFPGRTVMDMV